MNRAEAANFLGEDKWTMATRDLQNESASSENCPKTLKSAIEKGETDFAAGRGKTFSVEELEQLMHEPA